MPDVYDDEKTKSPDDLKQAEESASSPDSTALPAAEKDLIGSGFKPEKAKKKGLLARLSRRQKLIGGSIATLAGTSIIGLILLMLPMLRLEKYLSNIKGRAFGVVESAVENRMGHLMERYLIKHTLSLQACGNRATIDCKANYSNEGIASGLFMAWQDARIEEKLFDKYGITVESTGDTSTADGVHRFTIRDRRGAEIKLTNGHLNSGQFTGGSNQLGRDIRAFLKEETRWNQVMERRSIRRYLVRKHGVKFWCYIACSTRDDLNLRYSDAKTRMKHRLIDRVIFPFSERYGIYLTCLVSGNPGQGQCSPDSLGERGITRLSDQEVADILEELRESPNKRLNQIVIERTVKKVFGEATGKAVASGVPVAGQIYAAVLVIDLLNEADNFVANDGFSRYAADLNSRQYLEFYTAMNTANDELKANVLAADEIGALNDQFKDAEKSKVYQLHSDNPQFAFMPTVAAQESTDDGYLCANGKPIPADEFVCEEKKVARSYKIEEIRENPAIAGLAANIQLYDACCSGIVHPILSGIDSILEGVSGAILTPLTAAAKILPGVSEIMDFAEKSFKSLVMAIFQQIFPLPITPDMPGREAYDGLEAGAEVAASQFAQGGYTDTGESYGTGAKQLSDEEVAAVLDEHYDQLAYEKSQRSMFEKILGDHDDSIVSMAAVSAPSSIGAFMADMVESFSSLLSGLMTGELISTVFSRQATAQSRNASVESPFGIAKYGYPQNDPAFSINPADLTPEKCEQYKQEWENTRQIDEQTGFYIYNTTNPCLLEEVVAETAKALFTDENDGGL